MAEAALTSADSPPRTAVSFGPWLFGAKTDLAVFGGTAALALLLVALRGALGVGDGLPPWGFLLFVVLVDVGHVWSTLLRTYLDDQERAAHRLRYYGLPALVYVVSVALHLAGPLWFWRALAYLAVFHFVRQQVGWAAVYRARARQGALDRLIDDSAVYLGTLVPVLHWHAELGSRRYAWFVRGDFVDLSAWVRPLVAPAMVALALAVLTFVGRQLWLLVVARTLPLGKTVVVLSTVACWWVGIVGTNADFDFTATNVLIHGVPYIALLWAYGRERAVDQPTSLGARLVGFGLGATLFALGLVAFLEEFVWDRAVWGDQPTLFGVATPWRSPLGLALLVPLLALPQSVHYALDGLLWRRADTRRLRAQRAALGFEH